MNKRFIGTVYEKIAADILTKNGYKIIEFNYRCRIGEIDIIAKDGKYLCFIEVKYRTNGIHGNPLEAITKSKVKTIINVARTYLKHKGYSENIPIRFDAIAIMGDDVKLIKNAFGGM
ncbi:putative endonuclease [Eubacterium uniforme]|uniref:UPF0102 protein SAMN02745111_00262 n=1 Tax=Eubacterium uniforme TaxID=39495 RepID=A0A1T4V5Y3_9FIRM|nr:YraN family protein [Eubacterium uniforme]SKA60375.1 putative endonuclease [Eubacterium uniforme]